MAIEKLETDVHVKVPPEKFHQVFCDMTHHISNISPKKIKEVAMHEGEWGGEGSIIVWNYVHEGKHCIAKELVEAIDRENNSITFKVIEGDLLEHYKSYRFIIQVSEDKEHGGSVVHWTMEYEKLRGDVTDPHTMIYLAIEVSKDIESHLLKS